MSKKTRKSIITIAIVLLSFIFKKYLPHEKTIINNEEVISVELVRVIDGDTLMVKIDNKKERLRLIGMNTAESVKKNTPVECFSTEASEHAREMLSGRELTFQSDSSQKMRDRFGRVLGYIFIDGNINFAEQMIRDGYAFEYPYGKRNHYKYQTDFRNAEKIAKKQKIGLWSDGVCRD